MLLQKKLAPVRGGLTQRADLIFQKPRRRPLNEGSLTQPAHASSGLTRTGAAEAQKLNSVSLNEALPHSAHPRLPSECVWCVRQCLTGRKSHSYWLTVCGDVVP